MTRLLYRSSLRFYLRHPWQLGLAIAGVALGVAVYVGVVLANDSAARAFDLSAALVRGQATHHLVPIGEDLDEHIYADLVLRRRATVASPVVEATVGLPAVGRRVPVLGLDPTQEIGIREFAGLRPGDGGGNLARLMTEPGTVLLPETLAAELGVTDGASVTVQREEEGPIDVQVLGTLSIDNRDAAATPPILTDIATAQELFGRLGRLSRIDLRLTDEEAAALGADAPIGTLLVPAANGQDAFTELSAAFRVNLTALGLLALAVGAFLIYATISFAVLQRRATIGVLRAIGVRRDELLHSILVEALAVAAVATAVGLVLGHGLAAALVDLVLATIGDLRFGTAVRAAAPSPWVYVEGAALGLSVALLAAARPAIEAAQLAPAEALRRAATERAARRGAALAALSAVPVLAIAVVLLTLAPPDLIPAFVALGAVLGAGALLTPAATVVLMGVIDRALARRAGLPARLAVRGVTATLSRTGVATAALAVAVATVNGIGLMISSFRTSLGDWLDTTLTADLYVSLDADGQSVDAAILESLRGIDGVDSLSLARNVVVPTPDGEIAIRAMQPGRRGFGLDVLGDDAPEVLRALAEGRGVVASERLLFARDVEIGEPLRVPSPGGERSLPVLGGFRDFNTGYYSIVMSLDRYRRDWGDDRLTSIGIDLRPDADRDAVEAEVRRLVAPLGAERLRSSAGIRALSLEVFDRTFKITEVLRILAATVAFLGVLSALLALELERARETAVLRALGFSPRELAGTLLAQTGLLGLAAGVTAVPIGTALAALLVHVINRRSFGWSMDFVATPEAWLSGVALAVVAALLAGIYPAWRASRVGLSAALREE